MTLINYVTRINFDFGALAQLPDELAFVGGQRPLIVTDKGVVAAGLLERLQDALGTVRDAPVFDETPSNPTESAAIKGAALFEAEGCDCLVAIGGGSPMDLAKSIAILSRYKQPLEDFAFNRAGINFFDKPMPPIIAVPTTAGTGSEVGSGSLMTYESGRKSAILSPMLIPRVALCDPELTMGLPPNLTAATGMDAISHCIETYLSPRINPPAEAIGLDGLERGLSALERAVENGQDRDARWQMMMTAVQGAMCFQKGLGAVHSMSHPLGALGLHHGTLNAIFMPVVLDFNAPEITDKLDVMGRRLGLGAGETLADRIRALNKSIGIPDNLSALGVSESDLEGLPDLSLIDGAHQTNPRDISRDEYQDLFRQAL